MFPITTNQIKRIKVKKKQKIIKLEIKKYMKINKVQ